MKRIISLFFAVLMVALLSCCSKEIKVITDFSKFADMKREADRIEVTFDNHSGAPFYFTIEDQAEIDEIMDIIFSSGFNNLGDSLTEMRGAVSHLSDGMTSLSESIHLIKNAITVKDEAALAEAFDKAYTSMGVIIDSVGIFAEVMTEVADVLEEAKLWSDRLSDAFVGVTNAFTDITAALTKVQGGIDSLRANISLDLTLCEEGLSLIRDGFKDLGLATANIKDTLLHLSDAFADVQGAIGAMDKVAEDFSDGMSSIAEATDIITEMSNGAVTLLGYLKSVDKIQFPTPPESSPALRGFPLAI